MSKWILRICILIVFSVFFLNLLGGAIAEDCQDDGQSPPTPPGDTEYPDEWICDPSIYTDPLEFDDENTEDTIDAGGSVEIYVTGGTAPYTFETSNLGFTINGVQSYLTNSPHATLICGEDAGCDSAICYLSVQDFCGTSVEATISMPTYIYSMSGYGEDQPEEDQEVIPVYTTIDKFCASAEEAETLRDALCVSGGGCDLIATNWGSVDTGPLYDTDYIGCYRAKFHTGEMPNQIRYNHLFIYCK